VSTAIRELDTYQKAKTDATEQLMNAKRQLEIARTEVETCQRAKNVAEESIVKMAQLCKRHVVHQLREKNQPESAEQHTNTESRLEIANTELEICRKAKTVAEESLVKMKQLCVSVHQECEQRQEMQRETTKQLKDVETQLELAKTQLKSCQEGKVAAEKCLREEERLRASQRQQFMQLQRAQRETEEQLDDAKRRRRETLVEKERCQNEKNNVERELRRSKQEIESAYRMAKTLLIMLLVTVGIFLWMGWSWSIASYEVSNRTALLSHSLHRDCAGPYEKDSTSRPIEFRDYKFSSSNEACMITLCN